MHDDIVITDSSSLIAFHNINALEILQKLYERVVITPQIQYEYGLDLPSWITLQKVQNQQRLKDLNLILDKGEASAIALAMENKNSLLIIDEKKGRNRAKQLGLQVTGILGLILLAKEEGHISAVSPLIDALENVAFRMSQKLKANVLGKAHEL